jgi:hypothetical protein
LASLTVTETLVDPPYDRLDKPRVIGDRFNGGRLTLKSALLETSVPFTVAETVTCPCPDKDPTVNWTVAIPFASVTAVAGVKVPRVVEKLTGMPGAAVPSDFLNKADTAVVSLKTNDVFVIVTEPFADVCDAGGVPRGVLFPLSPPLPAPPPQAAKEKHIPIILSIQTIFFITFLL